MVAILGYINSLKGKNKWLKYIPPNLLRLSTFMYWTQWEILWIMFMKRLKTRCIEGTVKDYMSEL